VFERLSVVAYGKNRDERPEALLLHGLGIVGDSSQERGRKEISSSVRKSLSPKEDFRSSPPSVLCLPLQEVKSRPGSKGAQGRLLISWISEAVSAQGRPSSARGIAGKASCGRRRAPRRSRTVRRCSKRHRPRCPRQVDVGILGDVGRVLPAELEANVQEPASCRLAVDFATAIDGAGEGHVMDAGISNQLGSILVRQDDAREEVGRVELSKGPLQVLSDQRVFALCLRRTVFPAKRAGTITLTGIKAGNSMRQC